PRAGRGRMGPAMSSMTLTVAPLRAPHRGGAEFGGRPAGGCWCMDLPHDVALPKPDDEGARCLCPECLAALRAERKG
ncbi:MAG: cysteine-rich CWC family protein, partial [Ferrovibrionaceae bacterium]